MGVTERRHQLLKGTHAEGQTIQWITAPGGGGSLFFSRSPFHSCTSPCNRYPDTRIHEQSVIDREIITWVLTSGIQSLGFEPWRISWRCSCKNGSRIASSQLGPASKDYFDKLTLSLDGIYVDILSSAAKLDDLV